MSGNNPKYLVVIVGPTAVGKTDLCVELGLSFGTEIISADSRQFYKEMNIGTAKPKEEEMRGVPHHFINNKNIVDDYNVGLFEKEALAAINVIFETKDICILTGGSGLYIDAVCKGIDEMPKISTELRQALNEELDKYGIQKLLDELEVMDPIYFQQVDKSNGQRIIRALEVCRQTGKPYSSFRKSKAKQRPFNMVKIGLERDREELYKRIDSRMDAMIASGLFDEVKALYSFKNHNALQTVGYKEVFGFLDEEYDNEEAIRLLKRNSRRYAKRQMTWFRKDNDYSWFHPDDIQAIKSFISSKTEVAK